MFCSGTEMQLTFRKPVQLVERIEMRGEGENPVGRHLPSRQRYQLPFWRHEN